MKKQQILILSVVGILCLLPALFSGEILTGYAVLGISVLLLHCGIIYLALGLFTYLRSPITPYEAVVGTFGASGLVFIAKAAAMYYNFVLVPPENYSPLTLPYFVGVPLQVVLVTLPLSAGYLLGVLIRDNRLNAVILVLIGAIFGGWIGASWTSLSLGSAPGFTEITYLLAILATTVLGIVPAVVMAEGVGRFRVSVGGERKENS